MDSRKYCLGIVNLVRRGEGWGKVPEHVWGCAERCVENEFEYRPEICFK